MKRSQVLGVAIMLALVCAFAAQAAPRPTELRVGDKAPSFTLPDQYGHPISLSQFLGKKKVVLAFYVLDFTAG